MIATEGLMALPPRYEPLRRLGAGGGGEVWSVRDRIGGGVLAFKMLSVEAGAAEAGALVREAVALSGLEGLGVPRVIAFGTLADGRRYMVRELVDGRSLDDLLSDEQGGPWLHALATACDTLTVVHRSGLLHGDIKPANIIVGNDGAGTWVDLGLAAPWQEGGAVARGLTPRYAAPELLRGQPMTVRAEVFALGATLAEALRRRGQLVAEKGRTALRKVAERATQASPDSRWPSVDEFGSAVRRAALLPPSAPSEQPPWPVLGLDGVAQTFLECVLRTPPGGVVALEGPRGAGKTTLARRLAWTLGAQGRAVAFIEVPKSGVAMRDCVALELNGHLALSSRGGACDSARPIVVVDDAEGLDDPTQAALAEAAAGGARLVMVASRATAAAIVLREPIAFPLPPLDSQAAEELLLRSVPSLSSALREHLVKRTDARPGALRAAVRQFAGKPIVSKEDLDAVLDAELEASLDEDGGPAHDMASPPRRPSFRPSNSAHPTDRSESFAHAERALDRGRLDEARIAFEGLGEPRSEGERIRIGLGRARIALGQGDEAAARATLEGIEHSALAHGQDRAWRALRARAYLRAGQYDDAANLAWSVVDGHPSDALSADALSVRGVALAFRGDDDGARKTLELATQVAHALGEPRIEAVALGSAAIAHQRAGRSGEAAAAYRASLVAAERAEDATIVAAMRLNLAGLAQSEGDLAQALAHLEAAVDLGQRAGSWAAVTQALLNLANLDIYLGRWARARGSIDQLAARRQELGAGPQAQLFGLEAEHTARTGDPTEAAGLYEKAAAAWDAQGRPRDGAESRLEGLLVRTRTRAGLADAKSTALGRARELDAIQSSLGETGLGEHTALAEMVRGSIAIDLGDEEGARRALDASVDAARKAARNEWAWQALEARARLATSQGSLATARRDTEAALSLLEETASKLPRDLREVFWDDPRRRALRQAHAATALAGAAGNAAAITRTSGGTSIVGLPGEDRLARLLELTRELASLHDMTRLLQRVTDHAVALLGAERGFVLLVGDRGELEAHAASIRAGSDDPHKAFSHSVAERVLQTNEPVITVSARDDERLAEAVSVHQLMIQSVACVPIRGAPPLGRTIGALYVETRLRPGLRFEHELPTLGAFADQAAIAIENARLLSENRKRADELARTNVELEIARDDLARALGKRTEQLAEARRDLKQVRAELKSHFGYGGLVGTSMAMRRVYALVERIRDTDIALLVTGESGTGKEMIARAVHQSGPRAKKPFLGVNCGAIPANLLESELFGSVRGAFTGADRDRPGVFREAHGGTLLLDEIAEMPHKMQSGLLRVLQEKKVRPVGSSRDEDVDVRVIAATHCDLEQWVAEGKFREDLFYRLHVVELRVPALRERVEDVPLLVDHFISLFASRYRRDRKTVSRAALRRLCAFPWPGNVRQLEHVLLSAWLMTEGTEIDADDLELPSFSVPAARGSDPRLRPAPAPSAAPGRAESQAEHKAAERDRILGALAASNWNRAQAAKLIGVPRRTFYRRLKEFGLL